MPSVFLDTAGLFALSNSDDALYDRAMEVMDRLAAERSHALTTDWVLAEFLGRASRLRNRHAATRIVLDLQANRDATIVPATRRAWTAAFQLFRSRPDKEWSLVDCASILTCKSHNIRRVFTHDHHFTQAGFEVLL